VPHGQASFFQRVVDGQLDVGPHFVTRISMGVQVVALHFHVQGRTAKTLGVHNVISNLKQWSYVAVTLENQRCCICDIQLCSIVI
jgi:hypothetical protein